MADPKQIDNSRSVFREFTAAEIEILHAAGFGLASEVQVLPPGQPKPNGKTSRRKGKSEP